MQNGTTLQSFKDAFAKQTGPAVRFPTDQEFRTAIQTSPLYQIFNRKNRLADILWELEFATRTKYSAGTQKPALLSIEHILPQTWVPHWPLADGRPAPDDKISGADQAMLSAIAARDRNLRTLGNLTLVTVPGNTVASNSAFKDKSPWLKQSLLALNTEIVACNRWNETEIESRGKQLADRAVEVWPGLEGVESSTSFIRFLHLHIGSFPPKACCQEPINKMEAILGFIPVRAVGRELSNDFP